MSKLQKYILAFVTLPTVLLLLAFGAVFAVLLQVLFAVATAVDIAQSIADAASESLGKHSQELLDTFKNI